MPVDTGAIDMHAKSGETPSLLQAQKRIRLGRLVQYPIRHFEERFSGNGDGRRSFIASLDRQWAAVSKVIESSPRAMTVARNCRREPPRSIATVTWVARSPGP